MDKRLSELKQFEAKYEPLATNAAERSWPSAVSLPLGGIPAHEQGCSGVCRARARTEEATSIFREASRAAFEKVTADLDRLIQINVDGGVAASNEGDVIYGCASTLLIVMGVGGGLFAALACWMIVSGVSTPIRSMTDAMQKIAGGDKTVAIPALDRGDEVGAMAKTLEVFKASLIEGDRLRAEQEAQKQRAEEERKLALRKMADAFEGQVGTVVQAVTAAAIQLQASSKQMASTATETSAQATTVASAAEQASGNVQTVAAATEELAMSVNEIASQMERSQSVADRADRRSQAHDRADPEAVGERGQHRRDRRPDQRHRHPDQPAGAQRHDRSRPRGRRRQGLRGGGERSQGAGEPDRQGHRGDRGQDQHRAERHLGRGQGDQLDHSGHHRNEFDQFHRVLAVQQQTAATSEIARNVEQAAIGTREVSSNIVQVEAAARETGTAANQTSESASEMSRQADVLQREVARFLDQVRSDKKEMRLVTWDDSLAVGSPEIDNHHRDFINQLNTCFGRMMYGEGGEAAADMLRMLASTMKEHHAEEEELLKRVNYPALAKHAKVA